jgi:hypothetical protein
MWEKLLGLFKDTYGDDENYIAPSIAKRDARKQELASQVSKPEEVKSEGKGTLIGYNYLKGMDDEDNAERTRRFINLTKLLRGEYKDGKIEATSGEPEEDIRRKNS